MESKDEKKSKEKIKEALSCYFCSGKVLEPMICPLCKILFCSKCIKNWFNQNQDECPHCKTPSSFKQMISLPFMNYLSEFFVKIDNKKEEKKINKIIEDNDINNSNNLYKSQIMSNKFDIGENNINNNNNLNSHIKKDGEFCPKHKNEIIKYYCLNCNTKHCSKCLTIMNEESKIHNGHKIISNEERNRFNIEEIKNNINHLPFIVNELLKYKDNLEKDKNIMEKKDIFINNIIVEIKDFFNKKINQQKCELEKKIKMLDYRINKINIVKNNYIESLHNYIENNDEKGSKEFKRKIIDFQNTNIYKKLLNFNSFMKPNLQFYETDYLEVNINKCNETIGEIYFNVPGIEKQFQFKLNDGPIEEILMNILIELNGNDNELYYGFVFVKKTDDIVSIILDEKMLHNGILILGKTLIRDKLLSFVDEHDKLHIKIILALIKSK